MSKLLMFDFECTLHGLFEDLVKSDIRQIPCPQCGAPAQRTISPVRIDRTAMALQESATPTAIDHFDRIHRERKAIEERSYRDHGDYGNHAGSAGGRPITPEIAAHLG